DSDNEYDDPAEKVKEFIIQTNDKITDLCGYKAIGGYICGQNYLNILFLRPNPLVTIKSDIDTYSGIKIITTSPRGKSKSIIVWSSGEISVE
ncbi:hypothetical protein KJ763_02645, partial [Patescibacteria group bacterium]|nr:hypothetical protein [Patescibacteria group bacterium]